MSRAKYAVRHPKDVKDQEKGNTQESQVRRRVTTEKSIVFTLKLKAVILLLWFKQNLLIHRNPKFNSE